MSNKDETRLIRSVKGRTTRAVVLPDLIHWPSVRYLTIEPVMGADEKPVPDRWHLYCWFQDMSVGQIASAGLLSDQRRFALRMAAIHDVTVMDTSRPYPAGLSVTNEDRLWKRMPGVYGGEVMGERVAAHMAYTHNLDNTQAIENTFRYLSRWAEGITDVRLRNEIRHQSFWAAMDYLQKFFTPDDEDDGDDPDADDTGGIGDREPV